MPGYLKVLHQFDFAENIINPRNLKEGRVSKWHDEIFEFLLELTIDCAVTTICMYTPIWPEDSTGLSKRRKRERH
jgi:hypothetical protein